MQETSSLYKRLLADPRHWKEHSLVIGENGVLITKQGDRITFGSKSYTAEAKGSVIQLKNVPEAPLRGLTIYGKTTQNGTPTPDAPVPLVSAGDGGSLGVTVAGKNLLSNNATSGTIHGVTFTVNADGSVTMNGTATADASFPIFGNNWNDTSKKLVLDGNIDYILSKGTANAVVYARDAISNRNFETPLNSYRIIKKVDCLTYVYIRILKGKTLNNETIYPMIRLASIADDIYEPYKQSQTLNLSKPNGLPGIPVTSGGNYTDETGQQWVCDEVDFGRGVYVQRVHRQVFNGSESWTNGSVSTGDTVRPFTGLPVNIIMPPDAFSKAPAMCDSYNQKTPDETWYKAEGFAVNATHNRVLFYDSTITSISAWKTRLTSAPINCLFQLATPIETPLSAEELAAYAALHTNYPNTTILNDGGADMVVGYALNGEGPTNILVGSSGADSGFRESSIISMSTQKSIFLDSNPTVGNCISGQISIDMMKPSGNIPRRARISPYVRLSNGKESSEWIQKGVFFIDHREYSGNKNDRILINGYDHIILTEDEFPSSTNEWPRMDIDVVRDIANEIGVNVDERTIHIMNKGYKINYPSGYSMREVLENIAAMYAGSFIMSDIGELLLVTMFGIPKETSFLIDNVGFYITFGGDRILV